MCLKIIPTLAYNLSYQMSGPKEIQNTWLSVTYQQTKGHAGLQAPSVLQVPVTHFTVHADIPTPGSSHPARTLNVSSSWASHSLITPLFL